jgi:orotate phosphoribosyltransferase
MAHANAPYGAEFNRLLRDWVKHWAGVPIGNLVKPVSRSVIYERTKGDQVMEAGMLKDIVKGVAAELALDEPDTEAWIRQETDNWVRSRMEVLRGRRPTPIEYLASGSSTSKIATDSPSALPASASEALGFSAAEAPNVATHLPFADTLAVLDGVGDPLIREIAASNIFIAREKTPVGYHEVVPIGVYLDLHTASCVPDHRETLARFLADRVCAGLGTTRPARTVIATPREGNLLVGSRVAELLGVPFLMVRTKRAPRFGYPIEGRFEPGMQAIVVDDLVMGSLISRTAKLLRRQGLNVTRCFSIFERADADPRTYLDADNVELDSAWRIDDTLLAELAAFAIRP